MSDKQSAASQLTLYEALAAAQGEFPPIPKNHEGQVAQRKYAYADLSDVIKTVQPVLTSYNLAVTQTFDTREGRHELLTQLHHGDASIASRLPIALDGLTWQQAGSAITYARRYALTALLGVCADDDDDGAAVTGASRSQPRGHDHPRETTTQTETPPSDPALISETNRKALWAEAQRLHGDFADVALQDLLRALDVKRSTQIPANEYPNACRILAGWKPPEE